MSVSDSQYNKILSRLTKLENQANDLAVAIGNFVDLGQVNQLMVILQASIDALAEQVEALEERVVAIEEEPLN